MTTRRDYSGFSVEEAQRGNLEVYEWPVEKKQYVIGADTASGSNLSDWSVAFVIETATCDMVAMLRGKIEPVDFGLRIACLGWMYNEALIAIETHPSMSGGTCLEAARNVGYSKFYRNIAEDNVERVFSNKLGFVMSERNKDRVMNRIRTALRDDYTIKTFDLLKELLGVKFDQRPGMENRLKFDKHDDMVIAYGISLKARDVAVQTGHVSVDSKPKGDWTSQYWEYRKAELEGRSPRTGKALPLYDGT